MKLANRFADISASPTMAVMQEAQRLKKQGIDVIDLGPGEPDFPTPEPVKRAGIEAIEQNFTKYTASAGIVELRQAVAEKFNQTWGTDFTASHVLISCGAKHAIYNVCMTVFEERDEVLIPVPYWVTFPEVVKMTEATPRPVPTQEENGFVLELAAIEAELNDRSRGIIVNTPNNPTGAVIPGAIVEKLVELARQRHIFLLFDETYDYFTYGDQPHTSLASFVESSEDFYAIVGSLSKTYSMTGWRIGFCVGNKELIRKMNQFQSHATGNPTSISQKAGLAALESSPEMVQAMKEEYEHRLHLVLDLIKEIPDISCVPAGRGLLRLSQCVEMPAVDWNPQFCGIRQVSNSRSPRGYGSGFCLWHGGLHPSLLCHFRGEPETRVCRVSKRPFPPRLRKDWTEPMKGAERRDPSPGQGTLAATIHRFQKGQPGFFRSTATVMTL